MSENTNNDRKPQSDLGRIKGGAKMEKVKLLGTSPSLEMAKKLCAEFWFTTPENISFTEAANKQWNITNGIKQIENVRIIFKKGRYHFVMVIK